MRILSILVLSTLVASHVAYASDACQNLSWQDICAEDLSIMTSVRPQTGPSAKILAGQEDRVNVLYSLTDSHSRLSEEDLSQIRSVQPEGKKIVICQTGRI